MSSNPINLAVRFILEIAALLALGLWGWQKGDSWLQYVLAFGIPLVVAILWGTFRVPNDPGKAPIAVPGTVRLAFELAVFAFATWALFDADYTTFGWILGVTVAIHYILSYDRILWLIKQ